MYEISRKLYGFEKNFENIKNHILNNSLSNSLIFYGNKGIGKATFTYHLIDSIYQNLNKKSSFNESNLIFKNTHPNIRVLKKNYDEKTKKIKNTISIVQIRSISDFVFQSTINDNLKFVIIDSADDLNVNSSNALLKILEEPKNKTFFILISNQISSLSATIVSRCIKFRFKNPSINHFKKILLNINESIEETELNTLFDVSNSSPGVALELKIDDFNYLIATLFDILKENKSISSNIINFSNEIGSFDNDKFKIFLSLIKFILINLIKINLGIEVKNLFISNLSDTMINLSKFIDNTSSFKILQYLTNHEKDLFIFNLDKKIFVLNIFSSLSDKK